MRGCKNMDLLLFVAAGQPVIETSTDIRIGCFQFSYFSLRGQFEAAKLNVWSNEWDNVHDFSKQDAKEPPHWTYLPQDEASPMLKDLSESGAKEQNGGRPDLIVPMTYGTNRPRLDFPSCMVCIFQGTASSNMGFELIQRLQMYLDDRQLTLVSTRLIVMSKQQVRQVFSDDKLANDARLEKDRSVMCLHFSGSKVLDIISGVIGRMDDASWRALVRMTTTDEVFQKAVQLWATKSTS